MCVTELVLHRIFNETFPCSRSLSWRSWCSSSERPRLFCLRAHRAVLGRPADRGVLDPGRQPACARSGQRPAKRGAHPAAAGRGAAGPCQPDEGHPFPVHDARGRISAHAAPFGLRAAAAVLAAQPVSDADVLPAVAAPGLGVDRVLPAALDRDTLLHLLLHGGDEGSVFGRQGTQEAVLEVSHEVHDVVPATRGAEDHQ